MSSAGSNANKSTLGALMLGALGVVYGDIGTSPLYALKETFGPGTGVTASAADVIGAVSAIIWLLTLVVTLKYVVLILRADNRGEGGIMALLALASSAVANRPRYKAAIFLIGCFGACLFFGESILTPAISVLSAVEGLEVVEPSLKPAIVPISIAILIGLFSIQRHGTALVGRFFGPIILVWFFVIGAVGLSQISGSPDILVALNPFYGLQFLIDRGPKLLLVVGALVLAVTGVETLYADMGHFGKKAIRYTWLFVAYPGLILNYLGQGALILQNPEAIENPFYLSFPEPLLIPAILLSTMATVIASQATISGAYSATQQAIQLGLLPRMRIVHTSIKEYGQIYIPFINNMLLIAVLLVTLAFGSSSALASAYGVSVTMTMMCSTLLTFFVVYAGWHFSFAVVLASTLFFFALDSLLVAGCLAKILHGGWFPLTLGLVILTLMTTWKRGRELLIHKIREDDPELESFIDSISNSGLPVTDRTAVYLVANSTTAPQALMHNIKHNMVLHKRNVIVTVVFEERPWVHFGERLKVESLGHNFWRVSVHYGFKNVPDVPRALELCKSHGLEINLFSASYFISRETIVPSTNGGMAKWREEIFASLSRNAGSVVSYFNIPTNQVIELGTRVMI
ncbi:MAG: potassium transporter Kup [Betaproteobacteria bacterium]|nr:potassium transporter Kup [Betaproteobacteria bacterium]NBT75891.1 potassium transporter Kup [Betaproteobacteria bacterium]NBY14644.1 potassium transporter Kup [Betaproteobacteria bacterium]NCA17208.1 potassium transporter Kup [Betaproteobacteria bacterium]